MNKSKSAIVWLISLAGVALIVMFASWWFTRTYVGWLVESVPDSNRFLQQWQTAIDDQPDIRHPSVIHLLPDNCLCRVLTQKHASDITLSATTNGFNVFQLNSQKAGLGESVAISDDITKSISPLIVITDPQGEIAYLGAYSDGIRCNTGTSMVSTFISSPDTLPTRPVVGLDVETCRCTGNQ